VAEFAQFVAVTRPGSGLTVAADSNHNQGFIFDLPGIDCTRTVVLMFRVSGNAGSRLIMTNMPVPQFVGPSLIDFVLDNTHTKAAILSPNRRWRELQFHGQQVRG